MSSAPDDVLALLRKHGRSADPTALDALMRGVAAAPESLSGPEWIELIDPSADAEMTRALTAWRETPRAWPSCSCVQPRSTRSNLSRFFIGCSG